MWGGGGGGGGGAGGGFFLWRGGPGGGRGVTLIPEMAVAAETGRGALDIVRFAAPAPGRTLGLVYRASTARADDYAYLAEVIRTQRPV